MYFETAFGTPMHFLSGLKIGKVSLIFTLQFSHANGAGVFFEETQYAVPQATRRRLTPLVELDAFPPYSLTPGEA